MIEDGFSWGRRQKERRAAIAFVIILEYRDLELFYVRNFPFYNKGLK